MQGVRKIAILTNISLYLRNGTSYIVLMEYYWDLHMPFPTMSFRTTLSDLEWLIEIFNDIKHRAVSLQQLLVL